MAKVSLRIYNREIERLIDQGNTDEAIAHCRHILKTFPKHLETYRLLGKSYLESKRYNEAVDIFGRVLMSVPDDFVSHVGLSIIRDEENKLDDSIWHMERAFEAQPSNAAIQGELQRLYGRRDGMEPPKIRMTRGALAHMYVQGELYPQAIAEIRAVLSQDPQRSDMQVLLALSYFKGGQKSDASEMCSQLLKRYPYCFDANRIMVELLPATAGAAESTQVYRMRVSELDPYGTFAKNSVFESNDVADAAINLEKLEYTGEEVPMGQEWSSSLGIELSGATAASSTDQPDWLKSGGFSTDAPSQSTPEPVSASESNEEIPDFLRAAGWGESNTPEQPTSFFDEEPASNDLIPADLPDWLKGQAPAGAMQPVQPQSEPAQSIETPDWLSGLGGAASVDSFESTPAESIQSSDVPDWLGGLGGSQSVEPEPAQSGDVPDWLSGLGRSETNEPEPAQSSDVPDWLSNINSQDTPVESAPSIENLGTTGQEQEDAVAWLESLAAKHGAKPEELVTDPGMRSDIPPEWVSQAQNLNQPAPTPAPSVESLGATGQEQEDAVAWLESLAAKHGAKPEELVTDPSKRSETPPDWVQQAQTIGEAQAKEEIPSSQESEIVENALNIGEQFFAEFETASTAPPAMDETGMWLRNLDDQEKQDEQPAQQNADVPDWLSGTQQPSASEDQFDFAEKESDVEKSDLPNWLSGIEEDSTVQSSFTEQSLTNQDLSNWLSGLDDEPGLPFEPIPTPDSILFESKTTDSKISNSDEPVMPKSDLPDWLSDVDSEKQEDTTEEDMWKTPMEQKSDVPASIETEEPVSVNLTEDLPDWLQGVDEEKPPEAEVLMDSEDTPPWLHREEWEAEEPQQLKPTSPSDWRPVESKPKQVEKPVEEMRTTPVQAKPAVVRPVQTSEPEQQPVKKPSAPKRQRQPEAQSVTTALVQAKGELDRGDIPAALEHYGKLIKKGKNLEETIRDLSESIYRYPVEVGIWQTLGDAYMRANRLKEALASYNKAEELIR